MTLRISSCKRTAFWKDVTRFAPVWVGWGLFLGLILMTLTDGSDMDFWFPSNIASSLQVMGIFTCGYALLVTLALFGDLCNSRMCNALHAMPLKREHWFSVHVRAGIWFGIGPVTIFTLAVSAWLYFGSSMAKGWQIPLYWWAATNLSYLFFFGLAVFCVMCAGSRFAIAVLYGVLNFASVLVMFLVDSLYIPLLHGLLTPMERFTFFCPVGHMGQLRYLNCTRVETGNFYRDAAGELKPEKIGQFTVFPEHWNYLIAIALLGIALLVAARMLYKTRRLECAGDFTALPALTPLFQVVLTLMVTAAFSALYAMLFGNTGMMVLYVSVGLLTGWFATKMLLARSTRVFRPKNWLGLGILAAVLAGSLYLTELDPLGIEDWVPQVSQVKSASLQMLNYGTQYDTEDPEEIADFVRLHSLALEDKYADDDFTAEKQEQVQLVPVYLTYRMENGTTAKRRYYIPAREEEGQIAKGYFSRTICILQYHSSLNDAESDEELLYLVDEPESLRVSSRPVHQALMTESFVEELLTAIDADCKAGTMAQNYAFHDSFDDLPADALYVDLNLKNGNHLYLHIYPDCVNTLAVLEKTGIPDDMRENPENYFLG